MPEVIITRDGDPAQTDPFVRCTVCGENLCTVEDGDLFSTIRAVVEQHACKQEVIPAAVIASIQEIVNYNWSDEEGDYEAEEKPIGHVYEHLVLIQDWLSDREDRGT
jgi:hypothetical protein